MNFSAGIELERFVIKKCNEYKLPFRPSDMTAGTVNSESAAEDSKQSRKKRTM